MQTTTAPAAVFDLSNPKIAGSLALLEADKTMVVMTGTSKGRKGTKVFYQDVNGAKGSIDEEGIMPITVDEARGLIADASSPPPVRQPAKGATVSTAQASTSSTPAHPLRRATDTAAIQKAEREAIALKNKTEREIAAKAKAEATEKARKEREAAATAKKEAAEKAKKDREELAAKRKIEKEERAKKAAEARANRKAFAPGPGKGTTRIKDAEVDLSHYVVHEVKTPTGRHAIDINDEVANKLRGLTLDGVYEAAAKALETSIEDLKKQYAHLNPGMQRMNLGNKIRGAGKAKEAKEAKAKAAKEREDKLAAAKKARAEKLEATAKAKADAKAKREADAKAKAEAKAKADADKKAAAEKAAAEKAKADAAAKAAKEKAEKAAAEAKAKAEKAAAKPAAKAAKK